jgi:surface polysaccharide O-acyltransferase-like enzyme
MIEKKRNYSIDITRIIATFGVIAIHVSSDTEAAAMIGNFFSPLCVPFFYTASLTFFISGLNAVSIKQVLSRIWLRLAVPFLIWTLIYATLLTTKSILTHTHNSIVFWRVFLFGESSVQLYFVPQLIILQSLSFAIFLLFSPTKKKVIISLLIITSAAIYLTFGYNNQAFGITNPISIILYVASAFSLAKLSIKKNNSFIYTLFGLLLVIAAVLLPTINIDPDYIMFSRIPIGGIGLVLIAFSVKQTKLSDLLIMLTTATFGIYLSHILFLEGFEFILAKVWKGKFTYDLPVKIFVVSLIFMLSTTCTLILKKTRTTKQLLLGEKI